jgi:hypothetical protein
MSILDESGLGLDLKVNDKVVFISGCTFTIDLWGDEELRSRAAGLAKVQAVGTVTEIAVKYEGRAAYVDVEFNHEGHEELSAVSAGCFARAETLPTIVDQYLDYAEMRGLTIDRLMARAKTPENDTGITLVTWAYSSHFHWQLLGPGFGSPPDDSSERETYARGSIAWIGCEDPVMSFEHYYESAEALTRKLLANQLNVFSTALPKIKPNEDEPERDHLEWLTSMFEAQSERIDELEQWIKSSDDNFAEHLASLEKRCRIR